MGRFDPFLAGATFALAAACSRGPGPDTVAQVGEGTLTRADLDLATRKIAGADRAAALVELVGRERLAEAAREDGLATDPTVRAALAAAEREILAAAWLERHLSAESDAAAVRAELEARREALTRTEVHVAQILLRPKDKTPSAWAGAEARASQVYARLLAGEVFAELARTASDDAASASAGGDLGPIREGEVDPKFFEAARVLGAGAFSTPVRTAYGFHLIRAVEAPHAVPPDLAHEAPRLRAELRARERKAIEGELRDRIPVEVFAPATTQETAR
jgi:peptidyl-prolyl cis-trans isomerase C